MRAKIFALKREVFSLPGREDEVERLLKALAALFLRDVEPNIIERESAPSDSEFEPSVAEDVGDCRLFDDLHRVVQGQQGHCRPEPNPARTLRRRRQHHQRIGEDREGSAEVKFTEPDGIKAEFVAELDLRHDVLVALALGEPASTRQLVEKAEAHFFLQPLSVAARTGDTTARLPAATGRCGIRRNELQLGSLQRSLPDLPSRFPPSLPPPRWGGRVGGGAPRV